MNPDLDLSDIYVDQKDSVYKNIDISNLFDRNHGYAVLPIPHSIIDNFDVQLFLAGQREYINSDPNQLFVLGGFQALGNPSSFHHPERRKLMKSLYEFVAPVLAYTIAVNIESKMDYEYLSMIPDRFAVRRTDQQMGSETWHKDQSMTRTQANDSFLVGGWVNLDKHRDQYFSCIPGEFPLFQETQLFYQTQLDSRGGFTPEEIQNAAEKVVVTIPPYHLIMFNELLTHEVVKGPKKRAYNAQENSYRCYVKWYVSGRPDPYWSAERFSNFIEDQTQIGMSYFQPDAPMYASAHMSTSIPLLQSFSSQLIPEVKNFQFKDQTKYPGHFADRFMGKGNSSKEDKKREGLKQWGIAFEEYSVEDVAIYMPRRII